MSPEFLKLALGFEGRATKAGFDLAMIGANSMSFAEHAASRSQQVVTDWKPFSRGVLNPYSDLPHTASEMLRPPGRAAVIPGRIPGTPPGAKIPAAATWNNPYSDLSASNLNAMKLSMPTPTRNSSSFELSRLHGALIGAGVGGIINSGIGSQDGISLSGMAKGALTGGIAGAGMAHFAPMGLQKLSTQRHVMDWLDNKIGGEGATGAVNWMQDQLNTSVGRGALFASGGLLGGTFWPNRSSKRRGFNRNRGNVV